MTLPIRFAAVLFTAAALASQAMAGTIVQGSSGIGSGTLQDFNLTSSGSTPSTGMSAASAFSGVSFSGSAVVNVAPRVSGFSGFSVGYNDDTSAVQTLSFAKTVSDAAFNFIGPTGTVLTAYLNSNTAKPVASITTPSSSGAGSFFGFTDLSFDFITIKRIAGSISNLAFDNVQYVASLACKP